MTTWKWAAGTIVAAKHDIVGILEKGGLYILGHQQDYKITDTRHEAGLPYYWIDCDDGVSRPLLETNFIRGKVRIP